MWGHAFHREDNEVRETLDAAKTQLFYSNRLNVLHAKVSSFLDILMV